MKEKRVYFDYPLILVVLGLFAISLLAVYSGSGQYQVHDPYYFVKRQIIWYIIGFGIMIAVANFDFELLERLSLPLYGLGIVLLIAVHFFGTYRNGAQRWIDLKVFELQPSEFVKVFLIIYLSVLLAKMGKQKLSFVDSVPITLKMIGISLVPFLFILMQPDLGSALVLAAIAFTLLLVSNVSFKMIGLLISGVVAIVGFLVYLHNHFFDIFIKIIKPHQLERIYGWLQPYEYASSYGYQLTQAMLGIGSGQMSGRGFNQGSQVQSGKVPEAHTDFIFTVVGEEFGFIGAAVLISLFFLLIYRIIVIASRSHNLFGVYICSGVAGLFAFQVFQNIAMTIGVLPITGLPLPFISYGGSALLTNMIALGLVLSVNTRSKKFMFANNETELTDATEPPPYPFRSTKSNK